MNNWDSDPELKALRDSFLESFKGRVELLRCACLNLKNDSDLSQIAAAFDGIRSVAHKLAGSAESYGFSEVSEVSAALDDWLSHATESERTNVLRVAGYAIFLAEVLESALSQSKKTRAFQSDSRFKELLEAAQAVRSRF